MRRSEPKQPRGLAEFIAQSVETPGSKERVYVELCRQWESASAASDHEVRPSNKSVREALDLSKSTMSERLAELVESGRVSVFGAGRYKTWVPNEPRFTSALPKAT